MPLCLCVMHIQIPTYQKVGWPFSERRIMLYTLWLVEQKDKKLFSGYLLSNFFFSFSLRLQFFSSFSLSLIFLKNGLQKTTDKPVRTEGNAGRKKTKTATRLGTICLARDTSHYVVSFCLSITTVPPQNICVYILLFFFSFIAPRLHFVDG